MLITIEQLNEVPTLAGVWITKGQPKTMDSYLRIYRWELHNWCRTQCRLCMKQPSWGYIIQRPTRCADHKLPEMEYVQCAHCDVLGCDKFARGKGEFKTKCAAHGGGYRCCSCKLYCVSSEGLLCFSCRRGTQRYKQLELMVKDYIDQDEDLCHYSYYDERIPCAPTNRRPDFVWILEHFAIVVEVDEHSHVGYERSCEVARVLELHEGFGGKPMILIRFNPLQRLLPDLKTLIMTYMRKDATTATATATPIEVVFLGYPKHLEYDFVTELQILKANHAYKEQSDEECVEAKEEEEDGYDTDDIDDPDWF